MAKAFVDKMVVGVGGWCGSSPGCSPGLSLWGHAEDGGDVAFRILLFFNDDLVGDSLTSGVLGGYYRWAGGLLSQRADGVLTMSKDNDGPPWNYCEYAIHTLGGGSGLSLADTVGYHRRSLHIYPEATYRVVAVASPVKMEYFNGRPISRRCIGDWNWEASLEADLHIYYVPRTRRYACDQVVVGELTSYTKPLISGLAHRKWNVSEHEGYGEVQISFSTDIPAVAKVGYSINQSTDAVPQGCDPWADFESDMSEGLQHSIALDRSTLRYAQEQPKQYCYQVAAWPVGYRYVHEAKGLSVVKTFTLP